MTRLAIISDIHGNLPALEAVISDMKKQEIDQVIVAGDVINFGPFSNQTARMVIENNWPVIRGNNEYFLLDSKTLRAPAEWSDPVLFAPTIWTVQHFDPDLKKIISTWPDTINLRYGEAPPIQVFHGTPQNPWESIYWTAPDEEIEILLSTVEAEYVICGHTHLPMDRQLGKWHIFNPGSVGVPLDGIFSASYMILESDGEGWKPAFRRIPFDYDAVYKEFERSGFNRECGPIGRLILELYKRAHPTFGFLKWREQYRPASILVSELIDEFFEQENWHEFMHPAYNINIK